MKWLSIVSLAMCVLAQAEEVKTGHYRGKQVNYTVVDGTAVTEGDILLGTPEELERSHPDNSKSAGNQAIDILGAQYRWTDRVVPYVIDSSVGTQQRILDAIKHWNDNTPIQVVPRTDERN